MGSGSLTSPSSDDDSHGAMDWWMPGANTAQRVGVFVALVVAFVVFVVAMICVVRRWRRQEIRTDEIIGPKAIRGLFKRSHGASKENEGGGAGRRAATVEAAWPEWDNGSRDEGAMQLLQRMSTTNRESIHTTPAQTPKGPIFPTLATVSSNGVPHGSVPVIPEDGGQGEGGRQGLDHDGGFGGQSEMGGEGDIEMAQAVHQAVREPDEGSGAAGEADVSVAAAMQACAMQAQPPRAAHVPMQVAMAALYRGKPEIESRLRAVLSEALGRTFGSTTYAYALDGTAGSTQVGGSTEGSTSRDGGRLHAPGSTALAAPMSAATADLTPASYYYQAGRPAAGASQGASGSGSAAAPFPQGPVYLQRPRSARAILTGAPDPPPLRLVYTKRAPQHPHSLPPLAPAAGSAAPRPGPATNTLAAPPSTPTAMPPAVAAATATAAASSPAASAPASGSTAASTPAAAAASPPAAPAAAAAAISSAAGTSCSPRPATPYALPPVTGTSEARDPAAGNAAPTGLSQAATGAAGAAVAAAGAAVAAAGAAAPLLRRSSSSLRRPPSGLLVPPSGAPSASDTTSSQDTCISSSMGQSQGPVAAPVDTTTAATAAAATAVASGLALSDPPVENKWHAKGAEGCSPGPAAPATPPQGADTCRASAAGLPTPPAAIVSSSPGPSSPAKGMYGMPGACGTPVPCAAAPQVHAASGSGSGSAAAAEAMAVAREGYRSKAEHACSAPYVSDAPGPSARAAGNVIHGSSSSGAATAAAATAGPATAATANATASSQPGPSTSSQAPVLRPPMPASHYHSMRTLGRGASRRQAGVPLAALFDSSITDVEEQGAGPAQQQGPLREAQTAPQPVVQSPVQPAVQQAVQPAVQSAAQPAVQPAAHIQPPPPAFRGPPLGARASAAHASTARDMPSQQTAWASKDAPSSSSSSTTRAVATATASVATASAQPATIQLQRPPSWSGSSSNRGTVSQTGVARADPDMARSAPTVVRSDPDMSGSHHGASLSQLSGNASQHGVNGSWHGSNMAACPSIASSELTADGGAGWGVYDPRLSERSLGSVSTGVAVTGQQPASILQAHHEQFMLGASSAPGAISTISNPSTTRSAIGSAACSSTAVQMCTDTQQHDQHAMDTAASALVSQHGRAGTNIDLPRPALAPIKAAPPFSLPPWSPITHFNHSSPVRMVTNPLTQTDSFSPTFNSGILSSAPTPTAYPSKPFISAFASNSANGAASLAAADGLAAVTPKGRSLLDPSPFGSSAWGAAGKAQYSNGGSAQQSPMAATSHMSGSNGFNGTTTTHFPFVSQDASTFDGVGKGSPGTQQLPAAKQQLGATLLPTAAHNNMPSLMVQNPLYGSRPESVSGVGVGLRENSMSGRGELELL